MKSRNSHNVHNSCFNKIHLLIPIKHTLLTKGNCCNQGKSLTFYAPFPEHPDDPFPGDQSSVNQLSVDRNCVSYKIITVCECIVPDTLVFHVAVSYTHLTLPTN